MKKKSFITLLVMMLCMTAIMFSNTFCTSVSASKIYNFNIDTKEQYYGNWDKVKIPVSSDACIVVRVGIARAKDTYIKGRELDTLMYSVSMEGSTKSNSRCYSKRLYVSCEPFDKSLDYESSSPSNKPGSSSYEVSSSYGSEKLGVTTTTTYTKKSLSYTNTSSNSKNKFAIDYKYDRSVDSTYCLNESVQSCCTTYSSPKKSYTTNIWITGEFAKETKVPFLYIFKVKKTETLKRSLGFPVKVTWDSKNKKVNVSIGQGYNSVLSNA